MWNTLNSRELVTIAGPQLSTLLISSRGFSSAATDVNAACNHDLLL